MAECNPVVGLKLDAASSAALKRINEKAKLGNLMAAMLSAGVVNSIFTKSHSTVAAYNITQTDWSLYSKAMNAIPAITKGAVRKEIDQMILHYTLAGSQDNKHLKFWRGMKHGCQ